MKNTLIGKENNIVSFKMEFTAEEFTDAIVKAYQKNKGRFQVDGFRKGKAPRSRIEAFYGKEVFHEEALDSLINTAYPEALKELDIDPIDYPSLELGDTPLEEGKGFEALIKVEVMPEIEIQGYKGVEVRKVPAEVEDSAIERELENVRERNSRMVLVEDRPAKEGDTVLIDYAGFVGEEQFEGGTAERQPLTLGSQTFIPGFEDQLIGVAAGEEKDVVVTFPEEYHAEKLAGKEAVFKCKVHEIKEKQLDELNDDFAKEVSEFDTLEEYKADLKAKLQKDAEARARRAMRDEALQKVCDKNEFDIPAALVKEETGEMLRELEQQLSYQGISLKDYMSYLKKTPEDIKADMKEDAEFRVKNRLVMKGIADAEKLEVAEADIDEAIAKMAENYGMEVDKMKEAVGPEGLDYLKADLLNTKAVDVIMDNAVLVEAEAPAEEEK